MSHRHTEEEALCCDQFDPILDSHSGDEICLSCGRASIYLFPAHFMASSPFRDEKEEENNRQVNLLISELTDIAANRNVPEEISKTASQLVREEARKKKTTGRAMAAYCLYRAFYMHDVPRSLKELSLIYDLPVKTIAKYETSHTQKSLQPSQLAERALSQLKVLDMGKINHVKAMADKLYDNELSSASPQSALATSVALTFPELSLTSIAEQCHISRQTLAKHYSTLVKSTHSGKEAGTGTPSSLTI